VKVALVGFKSSGKTTVFNALTGRDAKSFGAAQVNLGVIKVPDPRVTALSDLCKPKKTTYAEVTFADVPGAAEGKGIDATTIASMRDQDAFVLVLGAFAGGDPVKDGRAFEEELVLADLGVVEKRLERLTKEKGRPGEKELLDKLAAAFGEGKPARGLGLGKDDERTLSGFSLLSQKPMLTILNVAEADAAKPPPPALADAIVLSGAVECEIARLDPADQQSFLQDLGLSEPARDRFVRAAYALLRLRSFFTTGEDEVRAWTIHVGDTAKTAAGKIHSDIERGFIRAEVIKSDDFLALGSEAKCREAGKLRMEGKEYVVQDGDVIHFRFAV
jgi:hypothetical protein